MYAQERDSLAQLGASSALTELLAERCSELVSCAFNSVD